MNRNLYTFFVAGLVFIGYSCHNKHIADGIGDMPQSNDSVIIIDVPVDADATWNIFGKNPIDAERIVDTISITPLETTDECLIGGIYKLEYTDSAIWVLDSEKAKALFRFDHCGRYKKRYGRVGQGPGEYVQPTDFLTTSDKVVILDQFQQKLLYYNYDGTYTGEVKLNFFVHEIASLNCDSLFLAYAFNSVRNNELKDYHLFILNTRGEIVSKGMYNPYALAIGNKYILHYDNHTYYSPPLSGSVYQVTPNSIKERYRLNILNSPVPKDLEEICKGDLELYWKQYRRLYNYFSGEFLETDKYAIFTINAKGNRWDVIYDKVRRRSLCGVPGNRFDPGYKYMGVGLLSDGSTSTANKFASWAWLSTYPGVEEDANPVVFSFSFKDNIFEDE